MGCVTHEMNFTGKVAGKAWFLAIVEAPDCNYMTVNDNTCPEQVAFERTCERELAGDLD